MLSELRKDLKKYSSKEKAIFFPKFFKTGVGEYGYGDKFIGVTVPNCRSVAKKFCDLNLNNTKNLLASTIHEERLTALLILVEQYKSSDDKGKNKICNFYLTNTKFINNWDLVDLSSEKIVGSELFTNRDFNIKVRGRSYTGSQVLKYLGESKNVWERRIAIVSTFAFIKNNNFSPTLSIAKALINDQHDLIHKAVGWMLREVGKRDRMVEEKFLKDNYRKMPRTMLRYAIEKFPEELRIKYLNGKI